MTDGPAICIECREGRLIERPRPWLRRLLSAPVYECDQCDNKIVGNWMRFGGDPFGAGEGGPPG